jgi:hypothetical protein
VGMLRDSPFVRRLTRSNRRLRLQLKSCSSVSCGRMVVMFGSEIQRRRCCLKSHGSWASVSKISVACNAVYRNVRCFRELSLLLTCKQSH